MVAGTVQLRWNVPFSKPVTYLKTCAKVQQTGLPDESLSDLCVLLSVGQHNEPSLLVPSWLGSSGKGGCV